MSREMDMYGLQAPPAGDFFHIDDLLDFSNDDLFSSSATTDSTDHQTQNYNNHHNHHHLPVSSAGNCYPPSTTTINNNNNNNPNHNNIRTTTTTSNFTDDLCVPNDDVAELEWLSKFVEDSFSDFAMKDLTLGNTTNIRQETSSAVVPGKARSKRTRVASSTHKRWISLPESQAGEAGGNSKLQTNDHHHHQQSPSSSSSSSPCSIGGRKCTHCASEKTPQWRTGPMGPKTLCNACGVRYKSGRLVPEYRPAASPTFVLTQHSNSHRKVMELRRQKEAGPPSPTTNTNNHNGSASSQDNNHQQSFFHHRPSHHDFEVC